MPQVSWLVQINEDVLLYRHSAETTDNSLNHQIMYIGIGRLAMILHKISSLRHSLTKNDALERKQPGK